MKKKTARCNDCGGCGVRQSAFGYLAEYLCRACGIRFYRPGRVLQTQLGRPEEQDTDA